MMNSLIVGNEYDYRGELVTLLSIDNNDVKVMTLFGAHIICDKEELRDPKE